MTKITIIPTKQTPEINFNFDTCEFLISGCSRPEDVELFYRPIIKKIEENKLLLLANPNKLKIKIHILYFNSSSLKFLLELLRMTISIKSTDGIEIHWTYDKDDEDVEEVGHEFAEALNLPFTFSENQ